jgi:hypothetical protein
MNEEGVWQELLYNKYLHSKILTEVAAKPTDSPFLERSNACEGRIFSRGFFKVGAGLITRFFEDTWLGHKPLTQLYPSLYNIVQQNQVTVATVLGQSLLNINFSRTLSDYRWRMWLQLVQRLMHEHLNDEKDTFVWGLTKSIDCMLKSMYLDLLNIFGKRRSP